MKENDTIRRYLAVYLCIGVMFATYSFAADIIFYWIQNDQEKFIGSWGWYLLLYLTFIFLTLPITIIYNLIINKLPKKNSIRILSGILVGALCAAVFNLPGFYARTKKIRTLIVLVLIAFTTEIIRILIVKRRERKKLFYSEDAI